MADDALVPPRVGAALANRIRIGRRQHEDLGQLRHGGENNVKPRAIRLKYWARIYSTRWQLDFADLLHELYGPDNLPLPAELRQRMALLHEIGAALDNLISRDEQWAYWSMPLPSDVLPRDLLRLSWPAGCLKMILEDLHQKLALLEIAERQVGHDPHAIVRFVEETIALAPKGIH